MRNALQGLTRITVRWKEIEKNHTHGLEMSLQIIHFKSKSMPSSLLVKTKERQL
jgi:hypothetical protein